MRIGYRWSIAGLGSLCSLVAAPLAAQDGSSVLSGEEVRALVSERAAALTESRSALGEFLGNPEVRRIAEASGIDIRDVESAAATLSDEEVERLAPRLGDAEAALAGGDTLVISSTAVIIGLLIIILIIVA